MNRGFGSDEPESASLPRRISRIVLTGFMGAGKTSVGRRLAPALGWEFVDLDQEIVRETGLTVPEIFAGAGEARFRELEVRGLRAILSGQRMVVALGGGSLESDALFEALSQSPDTALIFLDAPLPELLARCLEHGGAAVRPLLGDPIVAEERYRKRLPRYRKAHLTVGTSGARADATVRRIQEALAGRLA